MEVAVSIEQGNFFFFFFMVNEKRDEFEVEGLMKEAVFSEILL